MSDLVKRLRERDKYARAVVGEHKTLPAEAADEIERLTAERDDAREQTLEAMGRADAEFSSVLTLSAQVVALREALAATWPGIAEEEGFIRPGGNITLVHRLAKDVLRDTAAVAAATERRLRIEGAEAMVEAANVHQGPGAVLFPAAVVDAATAAGKWGEAVRVTNEQETRTGRELIAAANDNVRGHSYGLDTLLVIAEAEGWSADRVQRLLAGMEKLRDERALADKLAEALRDATIGAHSGGDLRRCGCCGKWHDASNISPQELHKPWCPGVPALAAYDKERGR